MAFMELSLRLSETIELYDAAFPDSTLASNIDVPVGRLLMKAMSASDGREAGRIRNVWQARVVDEARPQRLVHRA
jgi:hypothetical protein